MVVQEGDDVGFVARAIEAREILVGRAVDDPVGHQDLCLIPKGLNPRPEREEAPQGPLSLPETAWLSHFARWAVLGSNQ